MSKQSKPDWAKIKTEYIATDISYRKLADKYNVALRTIQAHANKDHWQEDKAATDKKIATKVRTKLVQKIATKKSTAIVKTIDPALEATDLINQLVLDSLKDTKQFYRHMIQKKEASSVAGVGSESKQWIETMETDVLDAKRLQALAQALKISKELQRLLQGEMDAATASKIEIERDKLKLDVDKSKTGSDGIIIKIDGEAEEWAE